MKIKKLFIIFIFVLIIINLVGCENKKMNKSDSFMITNNTNEGEVSFNDEELNSIYNDSNQIGNVNNNIKNDDDFKIKETIVIDPGHQAHGDSSQEPIGPGATETKAKVTTGATGVSTGQTEEELNLKVSMYLKEELEKIGYLVIMTRETANVNLSNSERAEIANNNNADAFIRIHANSYDNEFVNGVLTMCQTSENKYNGELYNESKLLSEMVVNNISKQTGFKNKGVTETDNMSGINWSKVPVTIVEMGFLSNLKEDELMATEEYRKKIAKGIADGVEEYFDKNK